VDNLNTLANEGVFLLSKFPQQDVLVLVKYYILLRRLEILMAFCADPAKQATHNRPPGVNRIHYRSKHPMLRFHWPHNHFR